jgi:hypothetical protein
MKLRIQTMLILLISTFIQGHENFDTNTAKLESKLTDHNNSIRIGKLYRYRYRWLVEVTDTDYM